MEFCLANNWCLSLSVYDVRCSLITWTVSCYLVAGSAWLSILDHDSCVRLSDCSSHYHLTHHLSSFLRSITSSQLLFGFPWNIKYQDIILSSNQTFKYKGATFLSKWGQTVQTFILEDLDLSSLNFVIWVKHKNLHIVIFSYWATALCFRVVQTLNDLTLSSDHQTIRHVPGRLRRSCDLLGKWEVLPRSATGPAAIY